MELAIYYSLQHDLDRSFFNLRDVCRIAGCTEYHLRNWIHKGYITIGRRQSEHYRFRYSPRDCFATALMNEVTESCGLPPSKAGELVETVTDHLVEFCRSLGGEGAPKPIRVRARFNANEGGKQIGAGEPEPSVCIQLDLAGILVPVLRKLQQQIADYEGLSLMQYIGRVWKRDYRDRRCLLGLNFTETREFLTLDNKPEVERKPPEICRYQELLSRHQEAG